MRMCVGRASSMGTCSARCDGRKRRWSSLSHDGSYCTASRGTRCTRPCRPASHPPRRRRALLRATARTRTIAAGTASSSAAARSRSAARPMRRWRRRAARPPSGRRRRRDNAIRRRLRGGVGSPKMAGDAGPGMRRTTMTTTSTSTRGGGTAPLPRSNDATFSWLCSFFGKSTSSIPLSWCSSCCSVYLWTLMAALFYEQMLSREIMILILLPLRRSERHSWLNFCITNSYMIPTQAIPAAVQS